MDQPNFCIHELAFCATMNQRFSAKTPWLSNEPFKNLFLKKYFKNLTKIITAVKSQIKLATLTSMFAYNVEALWTEI